MPQEKDLFDSDLFYDVPHADGVNVTRLDMTKVAMAEGRLEEVASVTTGKAQELLSFFNEIWLILDKMIKTLMREKGRAEAAVTDAYSDALLSCTDAAVLALGHKKTSADLRKALADRNPRVVRSREILLEIEAVIGFLRGKAESFYRAHHDVRDLRDRGQLPFAPLGNGSMPPVMGGTKKQGAGQPLDSDDPFGQNEEEVIDLPDGFGKPRY
jgi:hypothetical protein